MKKYATGLSALAIIGLVFAAGAAMQPEKVPSAKDLQDKAKEAVKTAQDHAKDAIKQPEGNPGDMGMDPKAMEAMMAAATPGEMHKMLAEDVGEWSFVNTWKMAPDKPEQISTGTAVFTSLYDGRYLQADMSGELDGAPFHGRATTAYNNVSKQFEVTWIDNFGTGIMFGTGSYDAAKHQMTLVMEGYDPVTGKKIKMTEVTTRHGKNERVSEYTYPGPDGKDFKGMTIKYTRKAGGKPAVDAKPSPAPANR